MRKIKIFLLLCLCALALIPSDKVKAESNVVEMPFYKIESGRLYADKKELYNSIHPYFEWLNIDDIESVTSESSIIKIDKKYKYFIKAIDSGIANIDVKIKETNNYKEFICRLRILVYPPDGIGYTFGGIPTGKREIVNGLSFPICSKNTLYFKPMPGPRMSSIVGKKTHKIFEIATDKEFKHIVKKYDIFKETLQIKNLKKAKIKKNKIYYIRGYYKKKVNGINLYSDEYCFVKFKINKKGYIKTYNTKSVTEKLNKNLSEDEILNNLNINLNESFDVGQFDELYKK